MREVGHSDKTVHNHYNLIMQQAHLAAAEQVAELVKKAGIQS